MLFHLFLRTAMSLGERYKLSSGLDGASLQTGFGRYHTFYSSINRRIVV